MKNPWPALVAKCRCSVGSGGVECCFGQSLRQGAPKQGKQQGRVQATMASNEQTEGQQQRACTREANGGSIYAAAGGAEGAGRW